MEKTIAPILAVQFVREDDFSRRLFKVDGYKQLFVEVDGKLHTITDYGEPNYPVKLNVQLPPEEK